MGNGDDGNSGNRQRPQTDLPNDFLNFISALVVCHVYAPLNIVIIIIIFLLSVVMCDYR